MSCCMQAYITCVTNITNFVSAAASLWPLWPHCGSAMVMQQRGMHGNLNPTGHKWAGVRVALLTVPL